MLLLVKFEQLSTLGSDSIFTSHGVPGLYKAITQPVLAMLPGGRPGPKPHFFINLAQRGGLPVFVLVVPKKPQYVKCRDSNHS